MKKFNWYHIYISDKKVRDCLRTILKEFHVYHEISECGDGWHFEVKCDEKQAQSINAKLDEIGI